MEFLELKEPGAGATMLVQRVERAKSNFGQDYRFIGNIDRDRQVAISVPEKATERQMEMILKITSAEETVNRFIRISRSDKPGTNGKLFWNIAWADQHSFDAPPPKPQRVQSSEASEDFAQGMRDDAAAAHARAQEKREERATPAPASEPEPSDIQKKNRAKMAEYSRIYHALWEAEAEFQVRAVVRVREKLAKEWDCDLADVPDIIVNGESAGAAAATQFIQYNISHLL